MSEYLYVEKPFLTQLAALGWEVIDQGPDIPADPARGLRENFREVALRGVFTEAVRVINTLEDGTPWLTEARLDALYEELTIQHTELGY